MKAAENKRAITVGIFVLIGIVILVTGIMVLGGQQKRFVKSIRVNAIFDNVGGLQAGANVWFSGVKIGTVRRIQFYGNSQVEVTMNIEESSQQYIRKDALAALSTDGLIGNKIVEIVGGSMKAGTVEDGDILHAKAALNTDEIMATLQQNNNNLLRVTSDAKKILDEVLKGKGMAGAVLRDSTMANRFKNTMANLQIASSGAAQATKSLSQVSNSLNQYAGKLNTKGTLASDLVSDTVIFHDLRMSSAKLRQVSGTAAEATENVKRASDKLNSSDNAIGILLNDKAVNKNLKNTIQNLESSSYKLDENLEALQHNFLLRGFFRRRAKDQAKQKEAAATAVTVTPDSSMRK
ncbi:MlaD family protein [Larkinella humicola]|uniref:MCE family protein n=1 Tax=Larkinella humicola TaxID=2607654 RepID=A0A5N1JGS4_9BACT|nr:MlaD family protein [Larkinella humicola]KAA9353697.1 MCE family protein [Larkinella humicola]